MKTLLEELAATVDKVLVSYERLTPCIDQKLVRRILATIQRLKAAASHV